MGADSSELENAIGYRFQNSGLLKTALTHPSYSSGENYERMEFLGDAVLELCVSKYLYQKYPEASEGELTKRRAEIVCSTALVKAAKSVALGRYLLLGKGEISTGGREKRSILENAFEAVVGAIYLDTGLDAAAQVIEKLMIQGAASDLKDYKSCLQEKVRVNSSADIVYDTYLTEGPPHNSIFYVRLSIGGNAVSQGKGKSKKQAEQEAAKNALAILK